MRHTVGEVSAVLRIETRALSILAGGGERHRLPLLVAYFFAENVLARGARQRSHPRAGRPAAS